MADKLKDRFFQKGFFKSLADEIVRVYPPFEPKMFFRALYDDEWDDLELKGRMRHAAEALRRTLPEDYRRALRVLMAVESRFGGFDHLVFADFVERFGVDDYDASIPALERLTRTTAEFAIRPFIEKYPERTMAQMLAWSRSDNESVRRLSSEGCRPRLPWGMGLPNFKRDPTPILAILEKLKDDPSEMVRRSVANNLGDIAKDHPDLVIDLAKRWMGEKPTRGPLLEHALRGPLKKGDKRALALFGVGGAPKVSVTKLAILPRRIRLGGTAMLTVAVESTSSEHQRLRLEYDLTYARKSGRTAKKTFQILQVELGPGEPLALTRKIDFQDRTVRKHFRGRHELTLVVNGERVKTTRFDLV